MTLNPNTFANNPLDRASINRADKAWLEAKWAEPSTRIVPFWQLRPFVVPVKGETASVEAGWVRSGAMDELVLHGGTSVFLGVKNDVAHFALDVSHLADPVDEGALAGLGVFKDLRSVAQEIDPGDAAILAQAKALIDWHSRHAFCAACGAPTSVGDGGYKRACGNCGDEHFPRTDPVVISLVVRGDRCLLGRGAEWPERFFSAIAGFMEPGESIEEAVAREVEEETSVRVAHVRYLFSQPWPYPSSLMIGCIAEAQSEEIVLKDHELAEARWFDRADIRAVLKGQGEHGFFLPPPLAIAHQLLKTWLSAG